MPAASAVIDSRSPAFRAAGSSETAETRVYSSVSFYPIGLSSATQKMRKTIIGTILAERSVRGKEQPAGGREKKPGFSEKPGFWRGNLFLAAALALNCGERD